MAESDTAHLRFSAFVIRHSSFVIRHSSFVIRHYPLPANVVHCRVKLSLAQKETFYRELEQFTRSGIPLQQAVEALAPETRGRVRRVLQQLLALLLKGSTVPDAFTALQPTFGTLEISLIAAAGNTGRLDQAFIYLSNYFAALETLRAGVVKRTIWPLIQLHFGVVVINVGSLFSGNMTFDAYLLRCAGTLAIFYAAGIVVWIIVALLLRFARANPGLDRALGVIPLLGKLRRHLALSRFCATYEMQLQAGINVMDSAAAAANASQSARIKATVSGLTPAIRAGSPLGALITGQPAFPAALQRSIRLGEESGSLDEDLVRWAGYYQKSAVDALETLGTWISRLVYVVIAIYFIYSIIGAEVAQIDTLNQMMK
jgi:type II secretory pathway component PulF